MTRLTTLVIQDRREIGRKLMEFYKLNWSLGMGETTQVFQCLGKKKKFRIAIFTWVRYVIQLRFIYFKAVLVILSYKGTLRYLGIFMILEIIKDWISGKNR